MLTRSVIAAVLLSVVAAAPAISQPLPDWSMREICARDSAPGQCVLFENRARNRVAEAWVTVPKKIRQGCLAEFRPPLEPSWRIMADCIGELSVVERVNVRKTAVQREILIVKKLKERRVAAERQAKREEERREAVRLQEQEDQRVAGEEASFLKQLAADRKRERDAKEAAEREAARLRELEEQRVASEEASFLKQLAADQKREREEAARRRAAEAAAKKEEPKPEPKKEVIKVEKPAEPATKAKPAPVLAAVSKTKRKPEVVACETRLEETAKAGTVLFALDSADLLKDAVITLDALSAAVRACGRLRVVIEGHTDSTGLVNYNQWLSERRAENVANYLISAGVKAGNVQFIGYGELRPVASNANRAGRAKNRRIEYRVR